MIGEGTRGQEEELFQIWAILRLPGLAGAAQPVKRSARAPRAWPPVVRQKAVVGHATAFRPFCPPGGLGVGWMDQVVPSQCSARVRSWKVLVTDPAAVHAVAAGQET